LGPVALDTRPLEVERRGVDLATEDPCPSPPRAPSAIGPDDTFRCELLRCSGMRARWCVLRQLATDAQRTTQKSRGQGTDHPSCLSSTCTQGRAVREALEGAGLTWRGAGPGGRFERLAEDVAKQEAARRRLRETGLLDEAPSMDQPPAEEDEPS
jgi:hypothetical protein